MMIEPTFLAQLRRRHRCQVVSTLVQLEQLCPNWWPTQRDLADQLGIIRSELCSNMQQPTGVEHTAEHTENRGRSLGMTG